jgi:hypothetical protein
MKLILTFFSLIFLINNGFTDTLRDFSKNGIFIDTGVKKIPSKKLKYGMEIDYSPKSQSVKVGLYGKDGKEVVLATVPTSANASCPPKIRRIGCHYVVGSRGTISPVNKKYNCMKLCK